MRPGLSGCGSAAGADVGGSIGDVDGEGVSTPDLAVLSEAAQHVGRGPWRRRVMG